MQKQALGAFLNLSTGGAAVRRKLVGVISCGTLLERLMLV